MAKYVTAHKELVEYINANKERLYCEAVGNFVVFVGDEDQFIHVWRFDEGYRGIDKTLNAFDGDQGTLFHVLFFGDRIGIHIYLILFNIQLVDKVPKKSFI